MFHMEHWNFSPEVSAKPLSASNWTMRQLGFFQTALLPAVLLFAAAAPAYAAPGELNAVIAHCGVPHAQNYTTSQVTGKPQRDLIYNEVTLHFEPEEGGWSFTTAWEGHFPVVRNTLETRLPCFKAALDQADAAALPAVDPTIAAQTTTATDFSQTSFGIPHLWLILGLIIVTSLILFLLPRRRRPVDVERVPDQRRYRKPLLRGRLARRTPRNPEL